MSSPRTALLRLLAPLTLALAAAACSDLPPTFDCESSGTCNALCRMPGESCDDNSGCCPGAACTDGACCVTKGESCGEGAGCCGGLSCTDGACSCIDEGGACGDTDEVCCNGMSCDATGHCRAACAGPVGACQPLGGACTSNGDCCASGRCEDGVCTGAEPATCASEGQACASESDCCGSEAAGSRFSCVPQADGGSECRFGRLGQACDDARRCAPGLDCVYPSADGGVGDAGIPADAGVDDAGVEDAGIDDAGFEDAGVEDAGIDDGDPDDAGIEDGPPLPAPDGVEGVCAMANTSATCDLYSATCAVGDRCQLAATNIGDLDPCSIKVQQQRPVSRTPTLVCGAAGRCRLPGAYEPCDSQCLQAAGDARRTICTRTVSGDRMCLPSCGGHDECDGSDTFDTQLWAPQPATNYCVNYGGGAACQPSLCYLDGSPSIGDPSVLYKPCDKLGTGSLCLPRYYGEGSSVIGLCTAVRPVSSSTVGQVCNVRAGNEPGQQTCGPDAICMGGVCAALCDASQLGGAGTPACTPDKTCVSPQGIDLIADYQYGGCVDPCNPLTDFAHSGCVDSCGGPPARCNWIIGDPKVGQALGYCGAALTQPLPIGAECTWGAIDPCVSGSYCLGSSDGSTRRCTQLCSPQATAGAPDACPTGKRCTAFDPLTRVGYCN